MAGQPGLIDEVIRKGAMTGNNYPPGVTGNEWQITGQCPNCGGTDECICGIAISEDGRTRVWWEPTGNDEFLTLRVEHVTHPTWWKLWQIRPRRVSLSVQFSNVSADELFNLDSPPFLGERDDIGR